MNATDIWIVFGFLAAAAGLLVLFNYLDKKSQAEILEEEKRRLQEEAGDRLAKG